MGGIMRTKLGVFILGLSSIYAYAQAPQRTTATYDDWTVSCSMDAAGRKTCELVHQITINQGRVSLAAQLTISRAKLGDPFKVSLQVPSNIWIAAGVKFVFSNNEPSISTNFRWCLPARCLADANLTDAVLRKLRTTTEPGRLEFKEATQSDVSLPVSFKGFGPALDVLEK
jgi:invasion protein IalB